MNRLAKIQAISGLCFALFLVLHLATTVSGVGGPSTYDGTLLRERFKVLSPRLSKVSGPRTLNPGSHWTLNSGPYFEGAGAEKADSSRFGDYKALYDRYMPFMPEVKVQGP